MLWLRAVIVYPLMHAPNRLCAQHWRTTVWVMTGKVIVGAKIAASIENVRRTWNRNATSGDWHTVKPNVDLRSGGTFSSRMEAKDASMSLDFAGSYSKVRRAHLDREQL
jgi:uncharacterized protein YndB with AHSA1/START domain